MPALAFGITIPFSRSRCPRPPRASRDARTDTRSIFPGAVSGWWLGATRALNRRGGRPSVSIRRNDTLGEAPEGGPVNLPSGARTVKDPGSGPDLQAGMCGSSSVRRPNGERNCSAHDRAGPGPDAENLSSISAGQLDLGRSADHPVTTIRAQCRLPTCTRHPSTAAVTLRSASVTFSPSIRTAP